MSDPWIIDETMLIFGGPYSNYAATVAMQNRATELGILAERVICTGDIIAYCGEPCDAGPDSGLGYTRGYGELRRIAGSW